MTETPRILVGLAYISAATYAADMRFYKVFDREGNLAVETVDPARNAEVWRWIQEQCRWPAAGVWYQGHPGLVWAPPYTRRVPLSQLRANIAQVAQAFEIAARGGGWSPLPGDGKLIPNEAVRYDLREPDERSPQYGVNRVYSHIASTRSRGDLFRLRQDFPLAGELAFVPRSVLVARHGQPKTYAEQLAESNARAVAQESAF